MLVPGFIEVAAILAGNYPYAPGAPWVLRYLLPPDGLDALQLTAPFLAGWALNLAGTLLRIHCYRKLDRHFTYELAVQKDQKLVTDGVYSIVRHPSYTAAVAACIGFYMAQLCPGSWVYEYTGLVPTAVLGTGLSATMVVGLGKRIQTEDNMLKNNFGEQWQEWAKRVPYRIIPGLI
ncbi:hypothetical protein K523DRAFT_243862 [Schizophyllum commune Tattone D]|nr:hypothetical protein K523DRAFT_243862 [Schizophyllum commune Tattone D]